MNKTASLIVRILAIVGALGAGIAWYLIHSQNIEVAMEKTLWLTQDDEVLAGNEFPQRMQAMDKVQSLLKDKRAQIIDLTAKLNAANANIERLNKTVAEQKANIGQLETERAELIRRRDQLTAELQQAQAQATQLQAELERATADLARKNEQISAMFTKEQYDEQVAAMNKAVDDEQQVIRVYTNLYNWIAQQGFTPPFSKNPKLNVGPGEGVQIQDMPKKYPTKIIAIDRRQGVLVISIGQENSAFYPGQVYDVDFNSTPVGKIRISDVRPGQSVASILPETNQVLLIKDAYITLTRAQIEAPTQEAPKPQAQKPGGAAVLEQPAATPPAAVTPPAADTGAEQ